MWKWLRRGLAALLVLLLAVLGGGWLWLRGSLPQTDGELRLGGLAAPVEIVRDANGVPHIFADSYADAAFALGFAHAQDRLWQMEMNRRIGAGRLSEMLGPAALDLDRILRLLGLYRHAEASFDKLDAPTRAALDAYAAGVNAFLEQRTGPLPPEFLVLGVTPAPWRPADSLVWLKVMALNLGGHWQYDLMRLRMAKRLDPARIEDFYTPYPADKPSGVAAGADLAGLLPAQAMDRVLALLPPRAAGIGSNNWVVAGGRSATGKPLLANDPHLGLNAPAVWYLAHLSWQGHNLIGATLPGVPLVILGRNDHIAWGFTNGEPDVQDLYFEKLDPADPQRYLAPDGPRPFAVRREVIRVKGAEDVVLEVRETRHGPVLSDVHEGSAEMAPEGYVLALAWTALTSDDQTMQAGISLGEVADWPGFLETLRSYHAPQQNIVYADVDGNIGFIAPGKIPLRHPDNALRGYMPQPGWDAKYDWQGFIPFDELPRLFNPPEGAIATANHRTVDDDYPHHLSFDWADGYRARRIVELLAATPRHDAESFRAMQADDVSLLARALLPRLRQVRPPGGLPERAHALLQHWNGAMDRQRPEPLLFNAWLYEFARLAAGDELGPLLEPAWTRQGGFLERVLGPRQLWCDDVGTAVPEDCEAMLTRALSRAVAWLAERHGDDPLAWRWGDEHVAVSGHRPFGQVPGLSALFDIRRPVSGSVYTLNVGDFRPFRGDAPFRTGFAASFRAIYDLADLDRSLFMHSTGQSGNVLSGHYRDFATPWANVDYIRIPSRRRDIAGVAGTLRLLPE